MALASVVAGLALSLVGTRFLQSLLYGVSATSVTEFAIAVILVSVITLTATLIPARRASRTDPAVVPRRMTRSR